MNKKLLVHFIGIGGIGMSGIAEVLLQLGYDVSGSDIVNSMNIEKLKSIGAQIFIGHKLENVIGCSVVVYTSAVKDDNPEIQEAIKRNIPIMKRAEMLAELMRLKCGLAVAGTHGKTTTSGFLATILCECNFDPTYMIGGIVRNLENHAYVGKGDYLIAEADESDGSFLFLNPVMSVITNIDMDHMDYYKTKDALINAFEKFSNNVPFFGVCSFNGHDKILMRIKERLKKPSTTYGIKNSSEEYFDYTATNINFTKDGSIFNLLYKNDLIGEVKICTFGDYNVLNALGAISLAHGLGIDFGKIIEAISKFKGMGRRYQILKDDEKLKVIDDYAHHPTAITKVIEAVRMAETDSRLVVLFEPHRFTRTRDCWNDFQNIFHNADKVYITNIYSAGEKPIDGINSQNLCKELLTIYSDKVEFLEVFWNIKKKINELSMDNKTVLLSLGAGSIGKNIRTIVEEL